MKTERRQLFPLSAWFSSALLKADKWSDSGEDPWKKRKVWEIEMFELVLLFGGLTREAMDESNHKQEFNNLKDS